MFMNIANPMQPGTFLVGTQDGGVTLTSPQLEGFEFETNDETFNSIIGPKKVRSDGRRRYRVVRNMSATAVTAGQVLIPSTVSGYGDRRVNGPQTGAGTNSYVADPDLVLAVPQYALFLIVTGGITQVSNAAGLNAVGNIVVSTTTSGDAATIADGSITAQQAANMIGRCVGNTAATKAGFMDVLIKGL